MSPLETDPVGKHLRDLARRGQVRTLLARRSRQPKGQLERARGPRAPRRRQRPCDPGEDLASRPVHDRMQVGGE